MSQETTKSKVSQLLNTKIEESASQEPFEMAQHSSVVVRNMLDPEKDRLSADEWDDAKVLDFSAKLSALTRETDPSK